MGILVSKSKEEKGYAEEVHDWQQNNESMDVKKYLDRLGIELTVENILDVEANLDLLTEIQFKHLHAVPWENLDIFTGDDMDLNEERIYDKVVTRNRGGWCFELNGLLCWALKELGYEAFLVNCQPSIPSEPPRWQRDFSHALIMVNLGQDTFLVDVAYNPKFTSVKPLKLAENEVQEVPNGRFRLRKEEDLWILDREINEDEWIRGLRFDSETKYDLKAFQETSDLIYSRQDPNFAGINSVPVVNLRSDDGSGLELLIADKYRKYGDVADLTRKVKIEERNGLDLKEYEVVLGDVFGVKDVAVEALFKWKSKDIPDKAKDPQKWS